MQPIVAPIKPRGLPHDADPVACSELSELGFGDQE